MCILVVLLISHLPPCCSLYITIGICYEQYHISYSTGHFCESSDLSIVVDMIHSFSTCSHTAVSVKEIAWPGLLIII